MSGNVPGPARPTAPSAATVTPPGSTTDELSPPQPPLATGAWVMALLVAASAVALLVAAGSVSGCARATQTPAPQPLLADDEVLFHVARIDLGRRAGSLDVLRPEYVARVERAPGDAAAHFLAGRAAADTNSAFKEYEKTLALDPDSYWGNLGLGEAYLRMGILHRAEERLRRAQARRDDLPHAHAALGEVERLQGNSKEAMEAFQRALERDSGSLVARRGLGEIYLAAGNRRSARRELQVAAALAPGEFDLQQKLGELLLEEGLNAEAVVAFTRATTINPNQVRPWFGLAQAAQALNQPDEAVVALERVLELQSTHQQARTQLAGLLRAKGELARADALYREALAANPDDPEVRRGQALTHEAQGRLAEALLALQEMLHAAPGDAAARARFDGLLGRIAAPAEPVRGKSLQEVFDGILRAVDGCHRQLQQRTAPFDASLTCEVEIDETGRAPAVRVVQESGVTTELRECALWTIRTAAFPARRPATVTFPLQLRQASGLELGARAR